MALDFTVLDAFVATSPGASVDDDLCTEIKTNLQGVSSATTTLSGVVSGNTSDIGTNAGDISTLQGDVTDAEEAISALQGLTFRGTDTLVSAGATVVGFDGIGTTDYYVGITLTSDPGGALGDMWVVIDDVDQFTVNHTGSATSTFMWVAIKDSAAGGGGK